MISQTELQEQLPYQQVRQAMVPRIYNLEFFFLLVFFEKIILFMPGKFWYVEILAILDQNLAIFLAKIASFESFWPITSKHRYESSYFFGSLQ